MVTSLGNVVGRGSAVQSMITAIARRHALPRLDQGRIRQTDDISSSTLIRRRRIWQEGKSQEEIMKRSPYPNGDGSAARGGRSPVSTRYPLGSGARRVGEPPGAPTYRVGACCGRSRSRRLVGPGVDYGCAVDGQNHVWMAQRGFDSLESNEKGPGTRAPSSTSAASGAVILEFDAAGQLLSSWGRAEPGYRWPQVTGGIAVDTKANVWITAAGLDPAPLRKRPRPGRGRGREVLEGREGRRSAARVLVRRPLLKFAHDGR